MERTAKRVRPASFKIEIPGSVEFRENFMQKVHKVREALVLKLQKPVNNADIFEAALDSWIARLPEQDGGGTAPQVCTSAALTERLTNQELYIVAKSSLHELVEVAGVHGRYCSQKLVFSKVNHRGHVAVGRLTCGKDKEHQYWWSSSPKLPSGAYFVNDKSSACSVL